MYTLDLRTTENTSLGHTSTLFLILIRSFVSNFQRLITNGEKMKKLMILLFALNSFGAFACQCQQTTPEDLMKDSDIVFLGVAKKDSHVNYHQYGDEKLESSYETKFRVVRLYKGDKQKLSKEISLRTLNPHIDSCGAYGFKATGHLILIAANYKSSNELETGYCKISYVSQYNSRYQDMLRYEELAAENE